MGNLLTTKCTPLGPYRMPVPTGIPRLQENASQETAPLSFLNVNEIGPTGFFSVFHF